MNEIVKEKFRALAQELKLQAKEYKRRLKDLNGEAKRLREMQTDYVPREVYVNDTKSHTERHEKDIQNLTDKIDINYKEITDLKLWKESQIGSIRIIKWLVGVVITILIGVAIALFTSGK